MWNPASSVFLCSWQRLLWTAIGTVQLFRTALPRCHRMRRRTADSFVMHCGCERSDSLAPILIKKCERDWSIILFCVLENLFAFIVDQMLAKCQVYLSEPESVDVSA